LWSEALSDPQSSSLLSLRIAQLALPSVTAVWVWNFTFSTALKAGV